MRRREMLLSTGAALFGLSAFPMGWAAAGQKKPQKVLYYTQSSGFEHSPVHRNGDELGYSEKVLTALGKQAGFDVVCTKDGTVFDGDLSQYDCFAFYTCGNLLNPDKRRSEPPMTAAGKQKFLEAIAAGKGFVGFHSAADSFHSAGPRDQIQSELDPYIAMLGGEFVKHGPQQVATLTVVDPSFPGADGMGSAYKVNEEWYALKNFAKDMHVILVQETEGMKGDCYQRPPFPATWARKHNQGRVFYTSFGHREDIWDNPVVQKLILGGFAWSMGNVDADLSPNLDKVAPQANQLKR